ncbi:MAG: GntR family transcriptional regulator [Deltaproteobacteria bacterium]|nr:GntR family transcriptional regulator [Deltaproteobacteria bacterium]MBM4322629.1 GntR family transcriptional regulator [Deltaproteobacteria bacterium]
MGNQATIDRQAFEPAYVQLVNILKEQIAQGIYLPCDRLPSESELCKQYHVSPMTVRRSINVLLDQGIVSTIQGSGTYVKAPDLGGVTFKLEEFQNIFKDKERTKVKVLEALITKSDEITANRLAIIVGEKTILIRRVLIRDGDPIIFHKEQLIYDPKRPIVEAELEVTSLHGLFVGFGESKLKGGKLSIEASVLTKEEADVLNTIPIQPAFRIEHTFYDFEDKPVSWGQFICRGDRLKFTTTIGIHNMI